MNLKEVTTNNLIEELQSRGMNTSLIIKVCDVDLAIRELNDRRPEDKQIILSHDDKVEVLNSLNNSLRFKALDAKIFYYITEEILGKFECVK